MSVEENKAIVLQHAREWTQRDPSTIDRLIAPDAKFFSRPDGIEGARQFYLGEFDLYSHRQYTIENPDRDLIADGDQVAVKLLFHGTRTTGEKEVKVGINIYRFKEGKICEGWGVWQDQK